MNAAADGPRRILVAMSGGVDSSVAAAMLVEAGHEVIGATMKTFCYSDEEVAASRKTCCGLEGSRTRARSPTGWESHTTSSMWSASSRAMSSTTSSPSTGAAGPPTPACGAIRTPSSATSCGGAACSAATASRRGHYVRLDRSGGEPRLLRGADRAKDQSYFLWGLPAELLGKLHFPLGELTKPEVRERARALGLVTADKPESQEICFVPTGNYRDFLEKKLLPTHPALLPGAIVDRQGRVLGRHNGYSGFTVGQRKGLGGGLPERYYVLEIRPGTRQVVVGPRRLLGVRAARVGDVNWLADPPLPGTRLQVQVRYRSPAHPCRVADCDGDFAELRFEEPVRAVTPGQSSVLFDGDRVIGGGRIGRVTESGY